MTQCKGGERGKDGGGKNETKRGSGGRQGGRGPQDGKRWCVNTWLRRVWLWLRLWLLEYCHPSSICHIPVASAQVCLPLTFVHLVQDKR